MKTLAKLPLFHRGETCNENACFNPSLAWIGEKTLGVSFLSFFTATTVCLFQVMDLRGVLAKDY